MLFSKWRPLCSGLSVWNHNLQKPRSEHYLCRPCVRISMFFFQNAEGLLIKTHGVVTASNNINIMLWNMSIACGGTDNLIKRTYGSSRNLKAKSVKTPHNQHISI